MEDKAWEVVMFIASTLFMVGIVWGMAAVLAFPNNEKEKREFEAKPRWERIAIFVSWLIWPAFLTMAFVFVLIAVLFVNPLKNFWGIVQTVFKK